VVHWHWNMQDVTIHDLRRTCASHLVISGENLPTIQNILNHTSLAHTAICARFNTKVVDRALQAQANRLYEGNGFDQAQLENRGLAMLTQG
jgi:integrase